MNSSKPHTEYPMIVIREAARSRGLDAHGLRDAAELTTGRTIPLRDVHLLRDPERAELLAYIHTLPCVAPERQIGWGE